MTSFVAFDALALVADDLRLRDYSIEVGPKSLIDGRMFGEEWVETNGFLDTPSKREHLMYLHLHGNSGLTARYVIAGIAQSDAYGELLNFDWGDAGLDQAIGVVKTEADRCQAHLAEKLPSGRIPLVRGIHCMSSLDAASELSTLQKWTQLVVETGLSDRTLKIDEKSGKPTGSARDVPVFTSTIDSWTPSLKAAKYWSSPPGNEFCMVMAAEVAHDAVVFLRCDGGADELVVLGGTGTANVYF